MKTSLRDFMRAAGRLAGRIGQNGQGTDGLPGLSSGGRPAGLSGGLPGGLVGGLPGGLVGGLPGGLVGGLPGGLIRGLPSGLARGLGATLADRLRGLPARAPVADPDITGMRSGTHHFAGLTRNWRLYVPPGLQSGGEPVPLLVMLHGCTQDPVDFAVGTGANRHARERGMLVLYPEQNRESNPLACWNWFKHNHQGRDRGEPGLIVSLIDEIARSWPVDADRIWVAGLSAGGAMAAILADAYPDRFAAVGVHSGLPAGAAVDLPQAMAAMKNGAAAARRRAAGDGLAPVPLVVFQGMVDTTVNPANGAALVGAQLNAVVAQPTVSASPEVTVTSGRRATRTVHTDARGQVVVEYWQIEGAGHVWSGGDPRGSYADAAGPDATGEMLRFFAAHPRNAR